jgi:hypothetical protein
LPKEEKQVVLAPHRTDVFKTVELAETLSEDMQKRIVEECIEDYETAIQNRAGWEEKRDDNYKRWRQIKEPKDFPWEDASNLMLPLTTAGVETYHPRLFDSIFGVPDPVQLEAMESADQKLEDRLSKFLNWQIMGPMASEEQWDLFIQIGEIEGTAIGKLPWVKRSRIIKEQVPIFRKDERGNPVLDYTNQPVADVDEEGNIKTKTMLKEDIIYENPDFDIPEQSDIIVPWNARNTQTADFVIHRIWMKPDTLRRRGASGKFRHVDEAIKASVNSFEMTMAMDRSFDTKNRAQGVEPLVTQHNRREPVLILEYYKRFDVDGDGFEEECIFWVSYHGRKLHRGKFTEDIFRHGKRPFIEWRFKPDPNRFYGIGIPEDVANVQDELDTIHNQRIDAGTIANIPFGFYRPASGYDPENVLLAPGTWIPVDDVNDVKFGQYPDVQQSSFQEEALLVDYYERLLGVNDNLQGRPSSTIGTRATFRGQTQLLEQSLARLNMSARRLRRAWDEFAWQVHQLDMQYLPPGVEFRVTNESGEPYYEKIWDRSEIKGRFDFRQRADVEVKTPQVRREEAQLMLTMGVQHPLLAQDMEAQGELLIEFFKSFKKPQFIKIVRRIMQSASEMPADQDPSEALGLMIQGVAVQPGPNTDLLRALQVIGTFRGTTHYEGLPRRIQVLIDSYLLKTLELYKAARSSAQVQGGEGEALPRRRAVTELAEAGARE